MHLPQANVTIYARDLVFEDAPDQEASLSTTPVDRTALEGSGDGLPGGDITVCVAGIVSAPSSTPRLILTGGATDQGPTGGNSGVLTAPFAGIADFARIRGGAGLEAPGASLPPVILGDDPVPGAYRWVHPIAVRSVLGYVRELYFLGFMEQARALLEEYNDLLNVLGSFGELPALPHSDGAELELGELRQEIAGLLKRLTDDMIGTYLNPNGAEVIIEKQPENLTSYENLTATFTVEAMGTSDYGNTVSYQWQEATAGGDTFNDIDGATSASYTTGQLTTAGDNGKQYRVVLGAPVIEIATTVSEVATLTVLDDPFPPVVESAGALGSVVGVYFDEELDQASAETAGNYTVSGVTVSGATLLGAMGNVLKLDVSGSPSDGFTVTVNGVEDLAGNAVENGMVTGELSNMMTEDVGDPGVDPVLDGDAFFFGNGGYYVAGGGSDIWNNADAFRYVYQEFTGKFDMTVRVESLTGPNTWTKALLMARESLDPGDRHVDVLTTRTDGQNLYNQQWRDTFGGASASKPAAERFFGVAYPNGWIRLVREEDEKERKKEWSAAGSFADGCLWAGCPRESAGTCGCTAPDDPRCPGDQPRGAYGLRWLDTALQNERSSPNRP